MADLRAFAGKAFTLLLAFIAATFTSLPNIIRLPAGENAAIHGTAAAAFQVTLRVLRGAATCRTRPARKWAQDTRNQCNGNVDAHEHDKKRDAHWEQHEEQDQKHEPQEESDCAVELWHDDVVVVRALELFAGAFALVAGCAW